MVKPLVRRLPTGDYYVRITSTLSFTINKRYYELLVSSAKRAEEGGEFCVPAPVYSLAQTRTMSYVIIPPFKADAEDIYQAGVYCLEGTDAEDDALISHGGVTMLPARMTPYPAPLVMVEKIVDETAKIVVETKQEEVSSFSYVALSGTRVKILHLPRAVYGTRVEGKGYSSISVVVPLRPDLFDSVNVGDVIEAYYVITKHGRGDTHRSGTSHQVDVYILL